MSHVGKEEKNSPLASIRDIRGVFLWEDPDQDQWSEVTRIMVDQWTDEFTLDKDSSVQ